MTATTHVVTVHGGAPFAVQREHLRTLPRVDLVVRSTCGSRAALCVRLCVLAWVLCVATPVHTALCCVDARRFTAAEVFVAAEHHDSVRFDPTNRRQVATPGRLLAHCGRLPSSTRKRIVAKATPADANGGDHWGDCRQGAGRRQHRHQEQSRAPVLIGVRAATALAEAEALAGSFVRASKSIHVLPTPPLAGVSNAC